MTDLQRAGRRAQRRLWLNRWLSAICWSLAGAATLFILAVLVDRLWIASAEAGAVYGWMVLGLAGAALSGSLVWLMLTREGLVSAAARLDVAAGLKERLSTALAVERSDDPVCRAVVADAHRVSRGLEVPRHMPVAVPTSANYAGATILLAGLLFLFMPTLDLAGKQQARLDEKQHRREIERARAEVKPLIEEQVDQLVKKHPDLKDQLEQLKPAVDADAQRPEDIRNEPLKQIDKLSNDLNKEKQKADLAKIEEFKRMARRLAANQKKDSLGDKLAKAMAEGDFKDAKEALEAMKLALSKAPQTEEEKRQAEELKKQLEQMSKSLEKLAQSDTQMQRELDKTGMTQEQMQRALEALKKQDLESLKKQLEQQGMSQEQIQKLMQKAQQCAGACKMASKMAQSMGQASQGAGSDMLSESAMQGLSEASDQLSEMESLQQQMDDLANKMDDLQSLKDSLCQANKPGQGTCPSCGGRGCGQCQGGGPGGNQGKGTGQSPTGMGQDPGRGQGGVAQEQETSFSTKREKAEVNTLPGQIIDTQFVNGEQFSGEVTDRFVEAVISAQRDITDAVDRGERPRVYHSSIKKYFDHNRSMLPSDKVEAAETNLDQGTNESETP